MNWDKIFGLPKRLYAGFKLPTPDTYKKLAKRGNALAVGGVAIASLHSANHYVPEVMNSVGGIISAIGVTLSAVSKTVVTDDALPPDQK